MQKSRVPTERICKCASIAEVSQYAWASGRRRTETTEVMRERGSIKGTANRKKKRMRNKSINYFRSNVVNIDQLPRIINC